MSRLLIVLFVSLLLSGCAEEAGTVEDFHASVVTLPNGQEILAEVVTHPSDMMKGMMFRESLAPDRGMLFIHGEPGKYPYWMFQVQIPLDIIWMDRDKKIVEIVPNAQPCQKPKDKAFECPNYGGNQMATFILELAAGSVERHNLQTGQQIRF